MRCARTGTNVLRKKEKRPCNVTGCSLPQAQTNSPPVSWLKKKLPSSCHIPYTTVSYLGSPTSQEVWKWNLRLVELLPNQKMEAGNPGLEQTGLSKGVEELHLSISLPVWGSFKSSSRYQACFVHPGVNAGMAFSDCVVPTHWQRLGFLVGIMWRMATHLLGVQAHCSCPASVSNGLEKVFPKERAQESSKPFSPIFALRGCVDVGIWWNETCDWGDPGCADAGVEEGNYTCSNRAMSHLMEVYEDGGVATSGFSGPVFKICLTFNCFQNPISVTFPSSFYPSSSSFYLSSVF